MSRSRVTRLLRGLCTNKDIEGLIDFKTFLEFLDMYKLKAYDRDYLTKWSANDLKEICENEEFVVCYWEDTNKIYIDNFEMMLELV